MKMQRGKLKHEDEKIIQRNFSYFKVELEARDLLDDLFTNEVISLDDKMRINEDGVSVKTFESTEHTDTLMTEVDNSCINVKDENDQIQRLKEEIEKDDIIEQFKNKNSELKYELEQKDEIYGKYINENSELKYELEQKDEIYGKYINENSELKYELEQKDEIYGKYINENSELKYEQVQKDVKLRKVSSERELNSLENFEAKGDTYKVVPDINVKSKTIGAEGTPSAADCENQDRHKEYIDINSFQKENLPSCYQHDEMLHLIKSLADLTVKIKVKNVHEKFEQFLKTKHEISFLSHHGSSDTLLGSGKVDEIFYRTEKDGCCECACLECKAVPKHQWGEVRILTSAQLAYDDEDATHFKCTLFYDDDSEKDTTKSLTGSKVVVFNAKNDVCMFICKTCDLDLIRKLDGMLDYFVKCWENAFDKFSKTVKWEEENLIFIVSHPHGGEKKISLGKRIMEKNNVGSTQLNYDTPTCVGSTGAYVLTPDFDVSDDIMS